LDINALKMSLNNNKPANQPYKEFKSYVTSSQSSFKTHLN